jgi:HEPN domain-containing protein
VKQATRDDAHRWIGEAENDIKDAEMLLRHEGYYPLCRLAYLAAAKAMRGLLLGMGHPFSEEADLAALSQQVSLVEPMLGALSTSLGPLQRFAPPARTADPEAKPLPPPLYSREAAKRAIALVRQAVAEAKRSLTALS